MTILVSGQNIIEDGVGFGCRNSRYPPQGLLSEVQDTQRFRIRKILRNPMSTFNLFLATFSCQMS